MHFESVAEINSISSIAANDNKHVIAEPRIQLDVVLNFNLISKNEWLLSQFIKRDVRAIT